jgi:hypothetical protein
MEKSLKYRVFLYFRVLFRVFQGRVCMDPAAPVAMDSGAIGVCMRASGNSVLAGSGNDNLPASVS